MKMLLTCLAMSLVLSGCTLTPWFAVKTLDPEKIQAYGEVMEKSKMSACVNIKANGTPPASRVDVHFIGCHGVAPESVDTYLNMMGQRE